MSPTHEITTEHLSESQCHILKQLVGRHCEVRGAALCQVLSAGDGPDTSRTWLHKDYGVVCLVKDHPGKQYIFRAYNLMNKEEVLSHKITTKYKYITKTDRFHYMIGSKDRMTGLNFVDEREAKMFKDKVDVKKEKWRFPCNPPHPPGLPDTDPPPVTLEDIKSYLPSDTDSQAVEDNTVENSSPTIKEETTE